MLSNSPNETDEDVSPDKGKLNADTVRQQHQQMFSRAQSITGSFEQIDGDPNEYGTTGIENILSEDSLQFGQQYRQNPTHIDPPSAIAKDLPLGTVPIESVTRENDEPTMDCEKQQLRNTTHGDITSDKVHCKQSSVYPVIDSPGFDLLCMSTADSERQDEGRKGGNAKVAKQFGDNYWVQNIQTGQQCKSKNERLLPEKKKCCALVQIQRMDNSNAHCPTEKYEFFTMDEQQHQMTSIDLATIELCNPSVGQMTETILSKHFGMKTIEQLSTQFDLKIQIRDRDFEPEIEFVDLAQHKWKTEPVEQRGRYKVMLYPKVDEKNFGGNEDHGMNVKKGVGGERHQHGQQETMMIDSQSNRVHRQLDQDEFAMPQTDAGHGHEDEFNSQRIGRYNEEGFGHHQANRGLRQHNEQVFDKQQLGSYSRQHDRDAFGQQTQAARGGYADGFSYQGYHDSRQRDQREQFFGSSLSADHSKWEQIDRFLLSGVSAPLANLYDAFTDNLVTSNDHRFMSKMSNRNNNCSVQSKPTLRENFLEIGQLDDLKECVQMLGMDQQLSVIGQLALFDDVSPLGQFLQKTVSQTGRGDSFGIIKMVPKMTFTLKLDNAKVRNSIMQQSSNNDFATHFVVSTCYGSIVAAIVTFNSQKAAGKVDISSAKNIVRKFFRGHGFSSLEKSLVAHLNNSTQCTVFVDPSFGKVGVDLNFTDGMSFFANATKNASHPIAFSLAPLSAINNKSPCIAIITSQMTDEAQIAWFHGKVISANDWDGQLRKISQLLDQYSYALSDEQLDTARQFLQQIEEEKKMFFVLLKDFIVDLRKGKSKGQMEAMELQKAVDDYVKNCQCVLGHYEKMLSDKKEQIIGLKQKGVNYVGRITRQQLSAIFDLTDSNSSILHFVLLMDPSGPPVQKQSDPGEFFCLCLGQLYDFARRGKCTFVDLNVLRSAKADDGLPEDIRALAGYPNIGTRLVKMRGNKLVTNNCVAEEERKSQFCVARIENLQRTEVGAVLQADQKDIEHCSLPCPFCEGYGGKCQNSDNLWECDDCGQILTFVKRENQPISHFYCACGKTPAEGLTYRCADVNTHGSEFKHFGSEASLNKELDRLNNKGVLTFLLLGETGVGKSTLINALIAYLKHTTFDEALQAKEIESVIPARFCTDGFDNKGNWKKIEVVLGEQNEDERLKPGESQTKWPKAYVVPSKEGHKVRIIDAPGICDTDGVNEDNINFDKTLNFISTLPELHAVCILMRPNSPKLTLALRYCIDGLLTYLHKNATENIVFLFTNARGSNYKMGKTGELLEKVLPPIEQAHHVSIPLQRKRIYCLDNEAYEALCLIKKADIKYDQEELDNFSRSWSQAEREFQRLFQHVSTLVPHRTWESVSVNEARRTINDLSEPLALITEKIQTNLVRIKDFQEAIKRGEEQLENSPTLETIKFVNLTYPRTVCTAPCCTNVQRTLTGDVKLFMKHCHEHCYLENITPELFPNEGLKYCAAMNGTYTCRECGCDWSVHMHYHYEQCKQTMTLDELKQSSLADQRADLSDLEKVRLQMLRERETIYFKAAHFCAFLKKWALKPYNDSMEAYINMSIKHAEKVVAGCIGSEDQKRQEDKLEGLRESLRLYREQKEIIDNASAEDANGPKVITAEDVKKFFDDLCELPIFGKNIRQMFETKQKSRHEHQKEYTEKKTGVGLKFKPTRSVKVVQTGSYLNEEQRKLLKDYEKKQKEVEQLEQKLDRMNMLQLPTGNTSAYRQPQSSASFWQQIPGFNKFFGGSSSEQNAPSSSHSVTMPSYPNNSTNFSSASGWDSVTQTYKKQQNWGQQ